MTTIRLAVNDELEEVLAYLEKEYTPMSRAEILKMGLTELMSKARQRERQIEILDERASRELALAMKEIREGKFKSFSNIQDLINDLTGKVDKVIEFTVGKRKK